MSPTSARIITLRDATGRVIVFDDRQAADAKADELNATSTGPIYYVEPLS